MRLPKPEHIILILVLVLLLALLPAAAYAYKPGGRVEEVNYRCSASGPTERRMMVYLPEGYDDTDETYPVLYLLHGARGNERSWLEKSTFLESYEALLAEGKASPMIVVFPNMNDYKDEEDFADSRAKGAFESLFEIKGSVEKYFREDVVEFVDSRFRTIRSKNARAIAGLSIGALQSIWISADNPQMFDYVGLFSPMKTPVIHIGPDSDLYRHLPRKLKEQFTSPPALYSIMIGRWDFFSNHMRRYSIELSCRGFRHELIISGGGHSWKNWNNYLIDFLQSVFK